MITVREIVTIEKLGSDSERGGSTSTKIQKKQSDYFPLRDRNLVEKSGAGFSHTRRYSLSALLFSLAILGHCSHFFQ